MPTTPWQHDQPHCPRPRRIETPRAAGATDARLTALTCGVITFLTAIKGETSRPHRPAELYRYFTKSFESAVLPKCRQFSSHLIGNPGQ